VRGQGVEESKSRIPFVSHNLNIISTRELSHNMFPKSPESGEMKTQVRSMMSSSQIVDDISIPAPPLSKRECPYCLGGCGRSCDQGVKGDTANTMRFMADKAGGD
jgi:hypothetical protein